MRHNFIWLVLTAFLMAGCSNDSATTMPGASLTEGSVKITFTGSSAPLPQDKQDNQSARSRSAEPPVTDDPTSENYVRKIQVFFYNSTDQTLECVRQYVKDDEANNDIEWDGQSGTMTVQRVSNVSKQKDIYVIANWLDDLPASLTTGSSVTELQKQITTIDTPLPATPSHVSPILMSGKIADHTFHNSDGKLNTATINIKRQAAKVTVKVLFDEAFRKSFTGKFNFADDAVKLNVFNMPSSSFIVEQTVANRPATATMLELADIAMPKTDNTWNSMFYSYENPQTGTLPSDKVQSTYFILNMPYTIEGQSTLHNNYYQVHIEDPNLAAKQSPHKTLRNNHYTVTVTVAGFGSEQPIFDAVHAQTKVTEWDTQEIEQEVVGKDMTINKTRITLNGFTPDKSIQIRGTTPLDKTITPSIADITYPDDMPTDARNLAIYFLPINDNRVGLSIQQLSAIYTGTGKTTFYVVYGEFRKKITVSYK